MTRFPARLHVLLAREKPVGVVIRRGPSKSVCTLLWDRESDRFTLGQWMHGRIYERRSDLSPDGRYLIYFAMNGKWHSDVKGSWTAISQAPYLKAITLLAKGDCWSGGGLFTGRATYWLNDGYGHEVIHESSSVRRDLVYELPAYYGGECPTVYYNRLQRDGWALMPPTVEGHPEIFEKRIPGEWILRKLAHSQINHSKGKGCYWDEHQLEHRCSRLVRPFPDWEWADVDRDRLVWARKGQLWTGALENDGVENQRVLYDFNDMIFEEGEAPY